MPAPTFTTWRCPVCGSVRHTRPVREAFCGEARCPDAFNAMVPYHEPVVSLTTEQALRYPEFTRDERDIDRIMRTNRGVEGLS